MTQRQVILSLVVAASFGQLACGIASNPSASVTLPYHSPLAEMKSWRFAREPELVARRTSRSLDVVEFTPYYPIPVGYRIKESGMLGGRSSWGGVTLSPPEDMLREAMAIALDARPGGELKVQGVITGFSWYEGEDFGAGRISTVLTVIGPDREVIFEQQRTTAAQARSADAVVRMHVKEWLDDPRFAASIGLGGS